MIKTILGGILLQILNMQALYHLNKNAHFGNTNRPSQAISAPAAARAILEFFPRLKHTKLVRTWGGMMDECADKIPVIDTCKEVGGIGDCLRLYRSRLRHRPDYRPAAVRAAAGRQDVHPAD